MYPKWVFSVLLRVAPTKGTVMLARFEQPENEASPMLVTDSGISMSERFVHPANEEAPTTVTEAGMFIVRSDVQFSKV